MKFRLILFIVITTGGLSQKILARTIDPISAPKNWTWVGSVTGGSVWTKSGKTQTFYLTPEIEKTYLANKSTNTLASGELFIGVQKPLSSLWLGQLGLATATTGNAKLQGVIWDEADAQFDNYSYQYKIRTTRVTLKGKLLFDKGHWFMPWVSASVGVGFNRAYDFKNTPSIYEAVTNSNYTNHTKIAFTYVLGIGIQKSISEHWHAGIGYEFSDWGKSELGPARGQTLNTRLRLNHLYTNSLMLNFTYVA